MSREKLAKTHEEIQARLDYLLEQAAKAQASEFKLQEVTEENVAELVLVALYDIASSAIPNILTALAWFTAARRESVSMAQVLGHLDDRVVASVLSLPRSNFIAHPTRMDAIGIIGGRFKEFAALTHELEMPIVDLQGRGRLLGIESAFCKICAEITSVDVVQARGREKKVEELSFEKIDLEQSPPEDWITGMYFCGLLTKDTLRAIMGIKWGISQWRPRGEGEQKIDPDHSLPEEFVLPKEWYPGLLVDWQRMNGSVFPLEEGKLPSAGSIMTVGDRVLQAALPYLDRRLVHRCGGEQYVTYSQPCTTLPVVSFFS